jgi:hypothetical protein
MENLSPEQVKQRKKAVFDTMSPRRREKILRMGYEKWDPFKEPSDPIDLRRDQTKRTTQQLIRAFLQSLPHDRFSGPYAQGAFALCLGLINGDEGSRGMFDFACWYQDELRRLAPKAEKPEGEA